MMLSATYWSISFIRAMLIARSSCAFGWGSMVNNDIFNGLRRRTVLE